MGISNLSIHKPYFPDGDVEGLFRRTNRRHCINNLRVCPNFLADLRETRIKDERNNEFEGDVKHLRRA